MMALEPDSAVLQELSISSRILGINISGMKIVTVYGDMNGLIYERLQTEVRFDIEFLAGLDLIFSQADKLLKICRAQGLPSPEVISLAVSGPVDLHRGIMFSPADLPLWDEAAIKGRVGVRYNLPVFIEHRSFASAMAEMVFGAGTDAEDQVFIDMEPVVSLGIIKGRAVYHGSNDAAGDIGRMRMAEYGPAGLGEPGSLTGFASGMGMAELASLRFPEIWPTPPAPYDLVKFVNEGQKEALQVVNEAAEHLGKALLWVIFTLDPELVIFGHPGDVLGEALQKPLRDAVLNHGGAQVRLLPLLKKSALGAKLDDVAALMAVIDSFKRRRTY